MLKSEANYWCLIIFLKYNKVFFLISQEERQRTISSQQISGGSDTVNGMAFMARTDNSNEKTTVTNSSGNELQKKERPFCIHCNSHGHTIERCYKIHGNPPSYKHKKINNNVSVNQVSNSTDPNSDHTHGDIIQGLNNEQYQQLTNISLFVCFC